jgi:uncharacterized protein with HEPN domain
MTDELTKRLLDALTACQAIATFTEGLDFSGYEKSLIVRSAVERQLEIIGEALNKAKDIDPALVEQLPELHRIISLRHRIIHGYDSVDDEIVWDVVQTKAPVLEGQLSALLEEAR